MEALGAANDLVFTSASLDQSQHSDQSTAGLAHEMGGTQIHISPGKYSGQMEKGTLYREYDGKAKSGELQRPKWLKHQREKPSNIQAGHRLLQSAAAFI